MQQQQREVYSSSSSSSSAAGRDREESGQWQVVALCQHHRLLASPLLETISKYFGQDFGFFILLTVLTVEENNQEL